MGWWLKDQCEKKKEETRAHNTQLHAAACFRRWCCPAVAAIEVATVTVASGPGKDARAVRINMAVASAQCVEATETLGAECDQLAAVVGSAINVDAIDDLEQSDEALRQGEFGIMNIMVAEAMENANSCGRGLVRKMEFNIH
ncbi:hypothetical protein J5N97_027788 [Dioscorea zingiberensis]|uniref:VAN3-binding protein-like auxin canalisation domain-containing protein n=1 Tax=Dioscorea zingiberensis TaxID=325984 RepID=A0A9D5BXZ4_9LILI|nr:hypothetical protein J5N97_027788 [Dioscorea zingiberensis]